MVFVHHVGEFRKCVGFSVQEHNLRIDGAINLSRIGARRLSRRNQNLSSPFLMHSVQWRRVCKNIITSCCQYGYHKAKKKKLTVFKITKDRRVILLQQNAAYVVPYFRLEPSPIRCKQQRGRLCANLVCYAMLGSHGCHFVHACINPSSNITGKQTVWLIYNTFKQNTIRHIIYEEFDSSKQKPKSMIKIKSFIKTIKNH